MSILLYLHVLIYQFFLYLKKILLGNCWINECMIISERNHRNLNLNPNLKEDKLECISETLFNV